mmetsp:Transcript_64385/g.139847  ORF Transcript_64385/g.139847 Transcript_64385/m.139847 type:complete len:347 (+) Transcript_64385:153-1193(+)|eukprot:CAMPEP_0206582930 /NCGR_PEP_ID=MMETSP0325_2-20121206/34791_1 /ASSEMBLY_ACC=CAM_ASM_000347 /TAXON_ID=2866 /ORGANISM="Crypthecodinium cohnii, Strain Seligo" /LENGTH=346 /DNA_ID=CAMNT_0054089733 /DNA_START=54 /DNA_END=1094 /DNA_ORIENTATION=+
MSDKAVSLWAPVPSGGPATAFGRVVCFTCYPALFPFLLSGRAETSEQNCKFWKIGTATLGLIGSVIAHAYTWRRWGRPSALTLSNLIAQIAVFGFWDHPYWWMVHTASLMEKMFTIDRSANRLRAGKLYGSKILVVGNGPSAVEGEPFGDVIDTFDEVVRFNNFQTKAAGMSKWVGTKTTVHFSDGVLYPTFTEYHVPNATVMLSLFADTVMVGGSYVLQRGGADLKWKLTTAFLCDPQVDWIQKADIDRLKKALGLKGIKHPTSGLLAIDYFLSQPGVELPIYIHGFDFFMGPKIHYFHENEPLFERLNNNIGVNMHSPYREKQYVEKLIEEGKVCFLKDMPKKK